MKELCGNTTSDTFQGVKTCKGHTETVCMSLKTHWDELETQLLNEYASPIANCNTKNSTDDDDDASKQQNEYGETNRYQGLTMRPKRPSDQTVERMSRAHTVCDSFLHAVRPEVRTHGTEMRE